MLVDEDTGVELLLNRWHQSSPLQKRQGRVWYLQAHDYALKLAFKHNVSLQKSAGILAALSPKNKWADNKLDADVALNGLREGHINQNMFHSHHPNLRNLLRIWQGIDPDKTLGQKAKSFYRCIYNPMTDEVCVDTWAAKALNYEEKWIAKQDYLILQNYYQLAAETVGVLPPVFQATVWIQIRGSHN